jgi:hypothetical protein
MSTAGSSILIPQFLELRISRPGLSESSPKEQQNPQQKQHQQQHSLSSCCLFCLQDTADKSSHVK